MSKVTPKALVRFLRTPKTSQQIIAEFGAIEAVWMMRKANDLGLGKVVFAPYWTDGRRFLYVVDDPDRAAYNRKVFARKGADWEAREVI